MLNKAVICKDLDGKEYEVPAHLLRWRPSAYAIVIKDDTFLVLPQFRGYDIPGGGVDIGETPEAAVIRETKEETGLEVTNPRLVAATSSLFKPSFTEKDEYIQSIMLYYVCEHVGGQLSTDGFDEYEKKYARMPEWLPLKKLDDIEATSSVDWRHYVRKVMHENSGD